MNTQSALKRVKFDGSALLAKRGKIPLLICIQAEWIYLLQSSRLFKVLRGNEVLSLASGVAVTRFE